MRTVTNQRGQVITFDPEAHKYVSEGRVLISVTTVIKKYFPKFEGEEIAARLSKKSGRLISDILAEWAEKGRAASEFGNLVHKMCEVIVQNQNLEAANGLVNSPKSLAYLNALKITLKQFQVNYDFVESEKLIFSSYFGVAGTIDLILRNKKTDAIILVDLKTNKEIKRTAFGGERGYGPCSQLLNCNFSHYSLQLALYKELLLAEGYYSANTNIKTAILHLNLNGDDVDISKIETLDLTEQAKSILENERNNPTLQE